MVQAEDNWQQMGREIAKGNRKSVIDVLEERGFINQIVGTRDDLKKLLDGRRVGVYCGIDPTAASMHVGHMVPFMALSWMFVHGYSVTFLLGGSTGRVGDPEGRLTARKSIGRVERNANVALMHTQLKRFGELMERYATRRGWSREWAWRRALSNNIEWHSKLPLAEMMTGMLQYVRLGPMLGRDSVKNRLEQGDGMSVSEFMYPMMQAWDWWHLYQKGTQVQIGGADQFGNILQGAECVKLAAKNSPEWSDRVKKMKENPQERAIEGLTEDPMGFTTPLLTTASGEKFGKSAGNAVWLSPDMTSVFNLYQFWLRTADADVERYLKLFTFLPIPEIDNLMEEHRQDESKRVAQHKLASEFVELVHGLGAAEQAEKEHRAVFNKSLTFDQLVGLGNASQAPQPQTQNTTDHNETPELPKAQTHGLDQNSALKLQLPRSAVIEKRITQVMRSAGLVSSVSEAQRLVNNKGVYIGGRLSSGGSVDDNLQYTTVTDFDWSWWSRYLVDEKLLVLRTGKWRVKVIEVISDEDFISKGLTCPGFNDSQQEPPNQTAGHNEAAEPELQPAHQADQHIEVEKIPGRGAGGWESVSQPKTGKDTQKYLDERALGQSMMEPKAERPKLPRKRPRIRASERPESGVDLDPYQVT